METLTGLCRKRSIRGMEARTTTRRWPNASGPWKLVFHWAEVGGRFECVGLDVRAARNQPDPLTTSTLRSLNLASLIDEERPRPRRRRAPAPPEPADEETRRIGRPPLYGFDHFVTVAQIYGDAWSSGRNPTQAVSEWGQVSPSTAAKWVYRARHEHGLLDPTPKGRAGGVDRDFRRDDAATGSEKKAQVRRRKR
jgi:hypothetical protein